MNRRYLVILVLSAIVAIAWPIFAFDKLGLRIYWAIISSVLTAIIFLALRYEVVGNPIGRIVGLLRCDNNYRWRASVVIAVIFTIDTLIAGFGPPLLTTSAREVKQLVIKQVDLNHPSLRSEINYVLWGERKIPEPSKQPEKKYASWWHIIIAGLMWLGVAIYFPISRTDEFWALIQRVWKEARRLAERKRKDVIRHGATVSTTPATASTVKDWFKGNMLKLFSLDIIAEFIPLVLGEFAKLFTRRK